jgi:hypothetical protein
MTHRRELNDFERDCKILWSGGNGGFCGVMNHLSPALASMFAVVYTPNGEYSMKSMIAKAQHFLFESRWGKWIAFIVGGTLLFTLYLLISKVNTYNSDNASIVLEAQSMAQGNFLMRGWSMPTDSFITIEIPVYALGLRLGFAPAALLYIVPALFYTLVVVSGSYLASLLPQGKQRIWGVLAFLGVAAFPPLNMVHGFLSGPIHIATIWLSILGLIAYRAFWLGGKGKKLAFAFVMLVTVLMTIGDPFVLVLFVLPILVTEGLQMLRTRKILLQEKVMIAGTLLATVFSLGVRWLLEAAGTNILFTAGFLPTTPAGMLNNFTNAFVFTYTMFHADIFTNSAWSLAGIPLFINALFVSALICATVYWCIRTLFRVATPETKAVHVLIWGSIGLLAAYIISTLGGRSARYLFPLFFFLGIAGFFLLSPAVKQKVLRVALLLVFVMNAVLFAVSLYQAAPAAPLTAQLITSLKEHYLTRGLGSYWVAPLVTVQSEGQIVVRQVTATSNQIHPYEILSDEHWFDASQIRDANFIVYNNSDDPQAYYHAAWQGFGLPDYQYTVGIYTVLVWKAPLLTHMHAGYSFWLSCPAPVVTSKFYSCTNCCSASQ